MVETSTHVSEFVSVTKTLKLDRLAKLDADMRHCLRIRLSTFLYVYAYVESLIECLHLGAKTKTSSSA